MHNAQYTFLDLLNNRVGTCRRSPNISGGIILQTVACVLRYHLRCAPEEMVRLEASMSIRGYFESHIHLHIQCLFPVMCNTQSLSWIPCTRESGMHNYLELWDKWMESASIKENQMLHAREMCEWPKEPAQIYVQSGRGWWEFIATLKLAQILLARARFSGRVTQILYWGHFKLSATLYTLTKCGYSVCTRPGKCAQHRYTSHCTQACFLRLSCFVFLHFYSSCLVRDGWNYTVMSMRSNPVNSRSPCVLCKRVRKHIVVIEGTIRNLRYLEHSSDMSLSGRVDLPCAVVARRSVLGTVFMW